MEMETIYAKIYLLNCTLLSTTTAHFIFTFICIVSNDSKSVEKMIFMHLHASIYRFSLIPMWINDQSQPDFHYVHNHLSYKIVSDVPHHTHTNDKFLFNITSIRWLNGMNAHRYIDRRCMLSY